MRRQLDFFEDEGSTSRPAPSPPLAAPADLSQGSSLVAASLGFDAHLQRAAKTEHTRRAFASDLRLLAEFLAADRPIGSIKIRDLEAFLSWLLEGRGRPCSPKTLARRVTTLKVFFAWLAGSGVIEGDPAIKLVHRRAEAPLPRVLDDGEALALLARAERWRTGEGGRPADPRPALLARLLLDTGLKKGEVGRLRTADLALEARSPSLLVRYDHPRWAAKERRVGFGPNLAPLAAEYAARYLPGERLFDCSTRNLEYVLTELIRTAGLPADDIGFETLRWTAALRHWRAGLDADALREQLGLSPISWVETERKLRLLADRVGPAQVSRYFALI